MNQQRLRKQHFLEDFLSILITERGPCKSRKSLLGPPSFRKKESLLSQQDGTHIMLPALQARCCCLSACTEITSAQPVGVSAWSCKTYV